MPNDRPGNRRPADEAGRVTPPGSTTQAAQEAFQNALQGAADRIQAQGLGPQLESAFGQIFDTVFDSILKSFSASAQRVTGGAAASTGGGGPTVMAGTASHGTYTPSTTTSASYAIGVRNQLAPTTTATGGVSATRTMVGMPVGIPTGQAGITNSASVYGLPPAAAGITQVRYSGGSAVISGAATMAATAPGMPNYASTLAPMATSAAGLPATAPPINPPGLPLTAPPAGAFQGVPAAAPTNYSAFQGVPAGAGPTGGTGSPFAGYRLRDYFGGAGGAARGVAGRVFGGMSGYGANIFGSLAGSATMGLIRSIDENQQDLINMNMLATQVRQSNADNVIVNQVTRGAAANQFGYTQSDIADAMKAYLPFTQGPNQRNNVGIGAFNQMAGFGSATGVGLGNAAAFVGQLGQAGVVGGARGGMGMGAFMNMAATGMGMSPMNNPQDFMNGLSQILQQQTNLGIISSPQISKSLTGYYTAFNQTGIAGLSGTQGAGVMNQINQGVANAMSTPYTAQQAYAALGQNLTPAQISYVTSGGAFNPQSMLGGQTPFQKYMNYARNTWGGLDTVSEAYQLAPMLGMTTYATGQLLQSNLMKNLAPSQFNANLKSFTTLAQKAGIDLTSAKGQTTVMDLANLAAAGTDPTKLGAVQQQMEKEGIRGAAKVNLQSKNAQQDLANLLQGGVNNPADPIRNSMNAFNKTLSQFYDRNHQQLDALKGAVGGVGGLVAAALAPSLVKGFSSVVGAVIGSSIGRSGGIIAAGVATGMEAASLWNAHQKDVNKNKVDAFLKDMNRGRHGRRGNWQRVDTDIPLPFGLGKGLGHPGLQYHDPVLGDLTIDVGDLVHDPKTGKWYDPKLGDHHLIDLSTIGQAPAAPRTKPVTHTSSAQEYSRTLTLIQEAEHRRKTAPNTGATAAKTSPTQVAIDQLVVSIPVNAVAKLVNGHYVFEAVGGTPKAQDKNHGGDPRANGKPRNNRSHAK